LTIGALARDHARARDLELVPLAPHGFHEDSKVELSAARYGPRIRRVRVLDTQRNVAFELAIEALTHLTRRDEFPVFAGERRIVDDEVHGDRRLFHGDALESLLDVDVRERQADFDTVQTRKRDDLTGGSR